MNASFFHESGLPTDQVSKSAAFQAFIAGGGAMGKLINDFDWAATVLGSTQHWPQSLRSSLSICLNSNFPIAIYWGQELILLYNDAWAPIPGNKHPWALGRPAREVWPDIWSAIEPQFQKAFQGEPGGSKDALLPMQRHGYTEECYFDFTFTPIFGERGTVDGIFNAVIETTYRVLNERRTAFLQKLSNELLGASTLQNLFQQAVQHIQANPQDIPFAMLYTLHGEEQHTLEATTLSKEELDCLQQSWPLPELLATGQSVHISSLQNWFSVVPQGYWPEPLTEALMTPLKGNDGSISGYIVWGISARRTFDAEYQSFLESVAASIGSVANTILSLEEERKRATALAEIDKAKTVFFSNISHEFRTPLTLMLGSLEELLSKNTQELGEKNKATLETTHRNTMRLLRLVNNLLDFSRIEAGRIHARFQPTDIATYTADLASSFQSLVENAGLAFRVQCEAVSQPVYLDREMWEKIVLNLLSNAFKYTLKGEIAVLLTPQKDHIVLQVKDTGVGIPQAELPHMFQRFHRVQSAVGRTYEGTGIGLSLVSELVQLHGGTISVESTEGVGSEFRVCIPLGRVHLPDNQILDEEVTASNGALAQAFIEEAATLIESVEGHSEIHLSERKTPTVLVVDDNADMRQYISRLLEPQYHVVTATNGQEALQCVRQYVPQLVVSDIMMPVMDGIAFVKEVKRNPATSQLPVILLSARAGEEATVEGYETGADDYLVKPFSAKELLARIGSHLKMARSRSQFQKTLHDVFTQLPVAVCILKGRTHVAEVANDQYLQLIGKKREQLIGLSLADVIPEAIQLGCVERMDQVFETGIPQYINEMPLKVYTDKSCADRYYNFVYQPLRDEQDTITAVLVAGFNVTDQVLARKKVEESEERFRFLSESLEEQVNQRTADLRRANMTLEEKNTALSNARYFLQTVLDSSMELVTSFDNELKYTFINKQAEDFLGLSMTPFIGKKLTDVHPGIEQDVVYTHLQKALDGETVYVQQRKSVTQKNRILDTYYIPLKRGSQVTGVVALSRDITPYIQLTEELRQTNLELERSNADLQQFAHVASHDLKEPIRKIKLFAGRLQHEYGTHLPEQGKVYLEKVLNATRRMQAMIDGVLTYSMVDATQEMSTAVLLNDTIESIRTDLEVLIEQKKAKLEIGPLPAIQGSSVLLYQLFYNLINNALKFSKPDVPPQVYISSHFVQPQMGAGQMLRTCVEIHVRDNGIGFEIAEAEQIFDTFTRLHSKDTYEGTGLGLALCKKIVQRHGGHIRAEGTKGTGAVFILTLPMVQSVDF